MRTGIFGGTFDPVHNGHLICAREVMNKLQFDRIIFIPTGDPPHKIARKITPAKDRLAMLAAAIEGQNGFTVCDIECQRGDYTYTYDTLIELKKTAPSNEEFFMIIGADTLADIFNWYRSTDVFRLCSFVAMKRPGCDEMLFRQNLQKQRRPEPPSASPIFRKSIFHLHKFGRQLPQKKKSAILSLRRSANISDKKICIRPCKMHFTEIYEDVKQLLSLKRFTHSIGVMEESARLGKIFGADPEKCRLAGLLHDCAKELTKQQYKWLGIKILECGDYDGKQVLLHGEAGAILARVALWHYGSRDS